MHADSNKQKLFVFILIISASTVKLIRYISLNYNAFLTAVKNWNITSKEKKIIKNWILVEERDDDSIL